MNCESDGSPKKLRFSMQLRNAVPKSINATNAIHPRKAYSNLRSMACDPLQFGVNVVVNGVRLMFVLCYPLLLVGNDNVNVTSASTIQRCYFSPHTHALISKIWKIISEERNKQNTIIIRGNVQNYRFSDMFKFFFCRRSDCFLSKKFQCAMQCCRVNISSIPYCLFIQSRQLQQQKLFVHIEQFKQITHWHCQVPTNWQYFWWCYSCTMQISI